MQRYLWMRPALQTSEAVLLPALPRHRLAEPRFSDRFTHVKTSQDPFRPIPAEGEQQNMALSTYVRPRGSMAGRSVLRAAGVTGDPFSCRKKPQYYTPKQRTIPQTNRWRMR